MNITLENVTKQYSHVTVLHVDSLRILSGQRCGLVGNNGAGKTTMLRSILDLILPDTGMVHNGPVRVSVSEEWKKWTGAHLSTDTLPGFLTAKEYFYFVGSLTGLSSGETEKRLRQFQSFLTDEIQLKGQKFIRDYSSGNQQKIGITAALLGYPSVLVLDEPFNSLDPTSQILLKRILLDYHRETKATLLISSHDLAHVTEVCERLVLLEKGRLVDDLSGGETGLMHLQQYFTAQ